MGWAAGAVGQGGHAGASATLHARAHRARLLPSGGAPPPPPPPPPPPCTQAKRILNLSGREARLPLKVLGVGKLGAPLKVHAASFSASAKAKIEAAGGEVVVVPQKPKWTRKAHEAAVAAAAGGESQ